jgi:hypothetical protein
MKSIGNLVRLEQSLQLWEDMCFVRRINRIHARTQKVDPEKEGRIIPGEELRRYLLTSYGKPFDTDRFIDRSELGTMNFGCVRHLPLALHTWINQSRRVYHLTGEMQTMFEATSLDGLCWNDVRWPLNSFVVTLECPLIDEKGYTYDCLMATRTDFESKTEYGSIVLSGFCTDLDYYEPIRKEDKSLIIRAAKKNSHESRAARRFDQWDDKRVKMHLGFDDLVILNDPDRGISETLKVYEKHTHAGMIEERKIALRLVIGLCMLMQTSRPDKYIFRAERPKHQKIKNNPAAITDESELFLVSCEHLMDRDTREIVRNMGATHSLRKLRPHWHPGYWRRPPGKGNDPSCRKTVWVSPYPVNGFMLPENSVPLTSRTIIA